MGFSDSHASISGGSGGSNPAEVEWVSVIVMLVGSGGSGPAKVEWVSVIAMLVGSGGSSPAEVHN